MRRADRLMTLIRHLRDGDLHRAADLARVMDVSLRTIYRDMETLAASGVPIEGERGTGYRVTAAITLPPLNLSMAELEALHVSLAAMGQAQDPDLADAASSLARKLDGVLPDMHAPYGPALSGVTRPANSMTYALTRSVRCGSCRAYLSKKRASD